MLWVICCALGISERRDHILCIGRIASVGLAMEGNSWKLELSSAVDPNTLWSSAGRDAADCAHSLSTHTQIWIYQNMTLAEKNQLHKSKEKGSYILYLENETYFKTHSFFAKTFSGQLSSFLSFSIAILILK